MRCRIIDPPPPTDDVDPLFHNMEQLTALCLTRYWPVPELATSLSRLTNLRWLDVLCCPKPLSDQELPPFPLLPFLRKLFLP